MVTIYKPPKLQVATCFLHIFEQITQKMPLNCPTIIIVGFKIYVLIKTYLKSTRLQKLINKHNFKLTFSKSGTLHDTQIDHVSMMHPHNKGYFGST
jgi:hypothetical protein